ncbi:MAG: amidohydrolase family protein, partial [Actinomycetota bacterium]|nr:amidohydrolase family protein [Actinomycetota bacterium]
AELKVARRSLQGQGLDPSARRLVEMVTSGSASIAGLDDKLGSLRPGRPADLVVFERREADPWENVVRAEPAWVELVMIDGDLAYGSETRMLSLAGAQNTEHLDRVIAWGKPMLLDTSFRAAADDGDEPPPSLAALRAALISQYPPVGPIFS